MAFLRRKGEFDDLEVRLRAGRPEPRDELVQSISMAVQERSERSRSVLRVSLAGALTLALLVTLAALGGISRSAAAANNVVTFVQTGSFSKSSTGGTSQLTSGSVSASSAQYEEKVTICHRTSATDPGNTLKLSPSGAANHLQKHQPLDYPGPCLS